MVASSSSHGGHGNPVGQPCNMCVGVFIQGQIGGWCGGSGAEEEEGCGWLQGAN